MSVLNLGPVVCYIKKVSIISVHTMHIITEYYSDVCADPGSTHPDDECEDLFGRAQQLGYNK